LDRTVRPRIYRGGDGGLIRVKLDHKATALARNLSLPKRSAGDCARACHSPRLLARRSDGGLNPAEIDEIMVILADIRRGGIALLIVEHVMRAIMSLSDRNRSSWRTDARSRRDCRPRSPPIL